MIDEILETGGAIIHWDARLTIVLSALLVLFLTQAITTIRSMTNLRGKRNPPLVPYFVPGLGNLIPFAFDTRAFLTNIVKSYGPNIPVRIRVLNQKVHFISGSESVQALFKGSKDLSTAQASILVLENAFGAPASGRDVLERDNTGIFKEPLPGSNPLEPHNRIFHINHKAVHRNLQGNALVDLADRYMKNLEAELSTLEVGDDWTEIPDFYGMIQQTVFTASTASICGPHLFRLNPGLAADFWEYDTRLPGMFKNLPRWMIPKAFKVREKLLAAISKWHRFASEHVDAADPKLADVEWEEYFGARIMRERQTDYHGIDGFTDEALAANDLGMLWAANANIVPIVGWEILDTILRPELLSRVRDEIAACLDPSKKGVAALDVPKLLHNPLLQSIYSEELRMRNGVTIQRVPVNDNFKIGSWSFPKGQMIITSSWHEQRDRTIWNEGPVNGEFHSVEDFWADRFLVYPNDPSTGPRKPNSDSKIKSKADETTSASKPSFTSAPVTGSFIPYGGGEKICPGRFYAKQEAIGSLAMFLTMFDVELTNEGKPPQMNLEYFPFGVIPPVGKIPARMRRRRHV